MNGRKKYATYYRFAAWLAVVVLVNAAGLTLFFRADLTQSGVYSLSRASREAVAGLSEPLTINVFFTKNLPAPYNGIERYLHDLLEEYAVHSNRYFNYRFYDVSPEEGDIGEAAKANQELARDYGIYPVQVQDIEQDEVKFQRAYMGMVFIHGDVVDKIPAITSTDGLEYTITSKIETMSNKISTLVGMEEPVSVTMLFSPALIDIAPHVRMDGLAALPERVEGIIGELNGTYYGRLAFSTADPSADSLATERWKRYNLVTLRWQSIRDRAGNEMVKPGLGTAAIVVQKGEKFRTIPLIEVFNVPLFGTQYRLADLETLGERVGEAVDDVIDINKKIGYLADHGTPPLQGGQMFPGQQGQDGLTNFSRMVSGNYSIVEVRLADGPIPDGIDCLIIAGPREPFNDWELFQIDQFLMRGKSLAVFYDAFDEMQMPQGQQQRGPMFLPVDTGLEKLLDHYGASVKRSYVLDTNCYEQQLPAAYGGGVQPIYFAPVIRDDKINDGLRFMRHVKALITVKSSPVELRSDVLESNDLSGEVVFSSSDQSWEMSGRIDLSPWALQPPADPGEMQSYPLAVLVTGGFPSWFAGKPVPGKPEPEDETAAAEGAEPEAAAEEPGRETPEEVSGEGAVIERGRPGMLFLLASSEVLRNNVIDEEGRGTSATFAMNVLDHLNGRDAYAEMRGKSQRFNPLRDTGPGVKTFVKTLNIAGLPVIVVAFGVIVWALRSRRKRAIQTMFGG